MEPTTAATTAATAATTAAVVGMIGFVVAVSRQTPVAHDDDDERELVVLNPSIERSLDRIACALAERIEQETAEARHREYERQDQAAQANNLAKREAFMAALRVGELPEPLSDDEMRRLWAIADDLATPDAAALVSDWLRCRSLIEQIVGKRLRPPSVPL